MQLRIVQTYKNTYRQVKEFNAFNSGEITYIYRVFERLLEDCADIIEELITVTTDNLLEMRDDERLKRIDALYSDMQDKYSFTQGFSNEAKLLAVQRMKEKNNVATSRTLYGIKS